VLAGGGQLALSDSYCKEVFAYSPGATLTNLDNTIAGVGQIGRTSNGYGSGNLTLVNAAGGVIDATHSDSNWALYIDTGGNIVSNAGLMEATGGGGLIVSSPVYNTGLIEAMAGSSVALDGGFNNLGTIEANGNGSSVYLNGSITHLGTIEANGNGATVNLGAAINSTNAVLEAVGTGARIVLAGATVTGTLQGANGTTIEVSSGTFDGSATPFTDIGNVVVDAGGTLVLKGTIDNLGTITVNGAQNSFSANFGRLMINGDATLAGGGQVVLSGSPSYTSFIAGQTGGATLTNVDNTITGAGYLGYDASNGGTNLTLTNAAGGIIDATGYLSVYTGGNTITNAGLMEATGGGNLQVGSQVSNTGLI